MSYDTNLATGLYLSSPIPLVVYKIVHYIRSPPEEPKVIPEHVGDPVAPTADEPSAV